MHAVILAAGWATRLDPKGTCKPLMPINKRQTVLDWVVNSLNHRDITCFHVVHNKKYQKAFVRWKNTLSSDTPGERIPYVKLYSNGITAPENSRGAVGDLYWFLERVRFREPIVLMCGDTVITYALEPFLRLKDSGAAVLAVRQFLEGEKTAQLGKVDIDEQGRVLNFYEKGATSTPWGWVGPAILPWDAKRLFELYLENQRSSTKKADNLGGFFQWLVIHYRFSDDGRWVQAWCPKEGLAIDVGSAEALERARKLIQKGN